MVNRRLQGKRTAGLQEGRAKCSADHASRLVKRRGRNCRDGSINRVEDLRGKRISLAALTPSEWLLTYTLDRSSLGEPDKDQIFKNLYKKNASPDARADFIAGKVDATVVGNRT